MLLRPKVGFCSKFSFGNEVVSQGSIVIEVEIELCIVTSFVPAG